MVNLEGRVQEIVQVEFLPEGAVTGFSRPDWRIFSDLAGALGCEGLSYQTPHDVREQIRRSVAGFPAAIDREPRRVKSVDGLKVGEACAEIPGRGEYLLVSEPAGYRHRGIDISSKVGGLRELELEEGFRMNPDDIAALGLKSGDSVSISVDGGEMSVSGPFKTDGECPRGTVYFTRPVVWGGLKHRRPLWPLSKFCQNPVRVSVSRAET
jgi:anaerobic selenocysteine-containing dehydrogenase